jgi:Concanavalin A-like lectin/glucanases superfamily/Immunoglobulin domain
MNLEMRKCLIINDGNLRFMGQNRRLNKACSFWAAQNSNCCFTVNQKVIMKLVLPSGRSCPVPSGNLPGVVLRASGCAAMGLFCLFSPFLAWSADCDSPPAGLVSWWKGEGNANDMAGRNNGTLLDGATYAPGIVGQAFSFDGMGGCVQMADNPSLHFTNGMTIEAWLYLNSLGANQSVVCKWDWTYLNAQKSYTTGVQPDGRILFGVCNDGYCSQGPGGASVTLVSSNSLPLHQWTHFAATYDGSALRIYVNGVCDNQTAYHDGIFPGTGDLLIGAAVPNGSGGFLYSFAGRIDEPAVYNRALSTAEIQAIYNAGAAGKCFGPSISAQPLSQVGYWGKSVTFAVTALGSAPLSYQWLKEGTPLAGASGSVLVLTDLQATNAGNYSVVISNSNSSITSSNAHLTVNPAGVSLALYSGITIDGVVGLTYGIQYSTDLSNTNGWRGIANVPLGAPTQLWFDIHPADQPQRYYRVVPGPINIP